MDSNKSSKVCEAEGTACKKDVQALCYHCSKNFCRIHLIQHAQLTEDMKQAKLNSLADKFNELSLRFDNISISDNILKIPFVQLEKWRTEALEKIDQIVEQKHQELNDELDKYRKVFFTKNEEQLIKMNNSKRIIAELIQESDASANQITDLQTSIDETENYLNSLMTHEINVIATTPIWRVDIESQLFEPQSILKNELTEFKITYVRLNGTVRNYYVKTKKDGKISDLINSFVRQYVLIEEFSQSQQNSIDTTNHHPKYDFILPTEVYNNRVHSSFDDNHLLNSISDRDLIVFYETPHSMNEKNCTNILMPCSFRRQTNKIPFGLPIYLNIPRQGCRGQHILDALRDSLGKYFWLNPNTEQQLYEVYLQVKVDYLPKRTNLNDVLQSEIIFGGRKTNLIVDICSQIADEYERSILERFNF
ncbi:unnamed protein product [Rotaria sp. Silwood1]|nr:unnamed protein product [Rotaria sp. Silwood1]CAF1127471.1 unnamed protein product [Rotaria sp. Silwood1]